MTDSESRMKGLIPICLLSVALISCGQIDHRTDCSRLLTIRNNSNSDQKIKVSELRMALSKRVKLPPKQIDLFCIHYLGKTPVVRRLSPKKAAKPLETWLISIKKSQSNQVKSTKSPSHQVLKRTGVGNLFRHDTKKIPDFYYLKLSDQKRQFQRNAFEIGSCFNL